MATEIGSSSQNYTNYTNLKKQITNAIGRYNNTYKKTNNKNTHSSIAIRNLIRKLPAVNQTNYMEKLNAARVATEPNYRKEDVNGNYTTPLTAATAATSSRPLLPPPPPPLFSRPLPPPPLFSRPLPPPPPFSRPLSPPPSFSRPLPPPPPQSKFIKATNRFTLNPNGTVPHLNTIVPKTHIMSVARNNGTSLGSFTAKVVRSKGGAKKHTRKTKKSQKKSKRAPKSLKRKHK